MRKILAVVALLCGAANASADTSRFITSYCSAGFDKPAIISAEGVVTIGGKVQKEVGNEDLHSLLPADIVLYDEGTSEKQSVIIFRDRVFWPCP